MRVHSQHKCYLQNWEYVNMAFVKRLYHFPNFIPSVFDVFPVCFFYVFYDINKDNLYDWS